jgi:ethanolamine kinase
MEQVLQLPNIVVNFDTEEALKQGAADVLAEVRPSWKRDELKFKVFTDGISNKLVGVHVGTDKRNMVLVRVYGAKTELIIDRDSEIRNMLVLDSSGCGCKLYAHFKNGLAYEFLPGEILTIETVKSEDVYPSIAKAMAKMHKEVDLGPDVPKIPCMWAKLRMFVGQMSEDIDDERLEKCGISKERLVKEVDLLEKTLRGCTSPIVFTHNDLLLANIVIDDGKVSFIDYEYGDYNYHECDIANHFDEMAGVENMDFVKNSPSEEFQRKWIRAYLQAFDGKAPSGEREEAFFVNVNKFSLCYHMMWGLWGLVQAKISKIDFDFVGFGVARLNEYFRVKAARLSL